jgi:hypothetical protein
MSRRFWAQPSLEFVPHIEVHGLLPTLGPAIGFVCVVISGLFYNPPFPGIWESSAEVKCLVYSCVFFGFAGGSRGIFLSPVVSSDAVGKAIQMHMAVQEYDGNLRAELPVPSVAGWSNTRGLCSVQGLWLFRLRVTAGLRVPS